MSEAEDMNGKKLLVGEPKEVLTIASILAAAVGVLSTLGSYATFVVMFPSRLEAQEQINKVQATQYEEMSKSIYDHSTELSALKATLRGVDERGARIESKLDQLDSRIYNIHK